MSDFAYQKVGHPLMDVPLPKYICKVRSFLEQSLAILILLKTMIIFNNTSYDLVLISADLLL